MKKITSGAYYSVFARPKKDRNRTQILIFRKDTLELEVVATVDSDSLSADVDSILLSLDVPSDWKKPHRACLCYFLKIKRKKDELSQKVLAGSLSQRQVFREISRFESYMYHFLKRLNYLSESERVLLLAPRKVDIKSSEDIDTLYAKDEIFGLFFSVTDAMRLAHAQVRSVIYELEKV